MISTLTAHCWSCTGMQIDDAGGTPAPRKEPADIAITPQHLDDRDRVDLTRKSLDYEIHDQHVGESSSADFESTSDTSYDAHPIRDQLDVYRGDLPRVRCLSTQPIFATLNEQHEKVETANVGSTFVVLEIGRDQAGLHKARSRDGWLLMLDEAGQSLEVEMLGPHEAWGEVAGYSEFVEWVDSASKVKAEADAAARSATILREATAALLNGMKA